MGGLLVHWILSAIAIVVTGTVLQFIGIKGFQVDLGQPLAILVAAVVLGLVNAIVRPLAELVSCAINFVTLGLFHFVITAAMLLLTSWVVGQVGLTGFAITDFWAALAGGVVMGIVSAVLDQVTKS